MSFQHGEQAEQGRFQLSLHVVLKYGLSEWVGLMLMLETVHERLEAWMQLRRVASGAQFGDFPTVKFS
ncbi:hypothetical protein BHS09_31005 [Myxococcus xanthus]|uniref:Uncharacterized protein n=1 Tax=Myxococcus xanthus TaxID=34 RepID=A0AAE6G517_MYXXA|nr:hypothetical protein BHS09_31005 [Myxococcus xanthus]QDE78330.1 hypothetical protein BHS08_31025 [Myxococcus xanthus]